MPRRFEFENDGPLVSGSAPVRRRLSLIGDTPGVALFCSLLTLAIAVLVFIPAVPGEERVLMYKGEQVKATELCITTVEGELVQAPCVEVGEFETVPTGWSVPGVIVAAVLAALALVVLARVPAQFRAHRKQQHSAQETLTESDRRQAR
ncbi:MAG: hypothetical protein HOQ43_21190 [Glycomyces artemisiae]|uniref:Uncharacterized protein n=1 Tax=Glycomyces artemisiae TaxID=1076443 RepID=A0A850CFX8_9ACTN|nr:hypothetical protein [Glycomyces artemisiae]